LLISTKPKKPIYDDEETYPSSHTQIQSPPTASTTIAKYQSPTPTDRLAAQISKSRMYLHARVAATENKVNSLMDSFFHLENSFTGTIASLAPSPESGEKLMPGCLYVLVAAMCGTIISRNRNILLRSIVPLAVGIGAGWVVLPLTMHNISDLLWTYEEKFPVLAENHLRTRKGIERSWELARIHKDGAVRIVDEKIVQGREAIEGWVKKGK
jgi:MICOS complex subunit MIC26